MHYVISDVHGEIDQLKNILDKIGFGDEDMLYILGDVINRGKFGIEILQFIKDQNNMILIRGNHEQMLIDAFRYGDIRALRMLCNNGGWETRTDFEALNKEEQRELLAYLIRTPIFLELEIAGVHYHLVHASYCDEETGDHKKKFNKCLWERQQINSVIPEDVIVIFGHTPTNYYKETEEQLSIFIGPNMIAIDCGLNFVENGRLGCMCLETKACYYL